MPRRKITTVQEQAAQRDAALELIASRKLMVDTLETRRSSADFHEVAVWQVRAALEAAFEAGRNAERARNVATIDRVFDAREQNTVLRSDGRRVRVTVPTKGPRS